MTMIISVLLILIYNVTIYNEYRHLYYRFALACLSLMN